MNHSHAFEESLFALYSGSWAFVARVFPTKDVKSAAWISTKAVQRMQQMTHMSSKEFSWAFVCKIKISMNNFRTKNFYEFRWKKILFCLHFSSEKCLQVMDCVVKAFLIYVKSFWREYLHDKLFKFPFHPRSFSFQSGKRISGTLFKGFSYQ